MALHRTILSAECHEPKYMTSATTADHGKVLTPSATTNGVSELVQLESADLSDTADIVLRNAVQTLTSKRIQPRVSLVTYAATLNVNSELYDVLACDSLTGNVTVGAPTGTPFDGQLLTVRLTQDGVGGRTIGWNAAFVTTGASTTTLSTTEHREFRWHAARAKWVQTALTTGI